jgi:hypothetical protein
LFCFDAVKGTVLWSKNLKLEYEIRVPIWGIAAAPLVEDNLVIIHAGGKVAFRPSPKMLTGEYQLGDTKVGDSALRFTRGMYREGQYQCLSFTGPYKHLKLGKGGAILTDDYNAYLWFKRARFSGRRECSYHDDHLDMIGWNFYMLPELAARGLRDMRQFYDMSGNPINNPDKCLPYPDLSKFPIYGNV